MEVEKSTKKKRLSKNKKKSWRKVDTQELDDFLEDQRLQERTGGIIADKPDEALFFVDKELSEKKTVESKPSRKRRAQEQLKDIEVGLKPPPPKKKDKRAPAVIEKERKGIVSVKQKTATLQRKQAIKERNQRLRTKGRQPTAQYDLWGDEPGIEVGDEHYRRVTKKSKVKAPVHLQKLPSLTPAVELPHPGMSYNPDYEEYQDLYYKAYEKELQKVKEEEKIERALDLKFPTSNNAPTEHSRLQEMSEGLFHDKTADNSDDDSDIDDDVDNLSVNPPVIRDNKKDERKRKKEKQLKQKAKLAEKQKLQRMKDNSIYRLKSIKAEIRESDRIKEAKAKKKAEERAAELYQTKRLGHRKFEEPDLPLKLSDELVGSLRELKPEGNLIKDRFQSYMKRNILEPVGSINGKKLGRKYKRKVYVKKSHKDPQ
ncbi:Glioma tumor suppressor candidate region protein 2 [Mactra antiquata]